MQWKTSSSVTEVPSSPLFTYIKILIILLEADPIPEQVVLLSQEIYTSDLLQILSLNLYRFEFEAKKDFTSIFNTLLRRQVGETRYPTVEYLAQKGEILLVLTKGLVSSNKILNING